LQTHRKDFYTDRKNDRHDKIKKRKKEYGSGVESNHHEKDYQFRGVLGKEFDIKGPKTNATRTAIY